MWDPHTGKNDVRDATSSRIERQRCSDEPPRSNTAQYRQQILLRVQHTHIGSSWVWWFLRTMNNDLTALNDVCQVFIFYFFVSQEEVASSNGWCRAWHTPEYVALDDTLGDEVFQNSIYVERRVFMYCCTLWSPVLSNDIYGERAEYEGPYIYSMVYVAQHIIQSNIYMVWRLSNNVSVFPHACCWSSSKVIYTRSSRCPIYDVLARFWEQMEAKTYVLSASGKVPSTAGGKGQGFSCFTCCKY